jgi:flotillin
MSDIFNVLGGGVFATAALIVVIVLLVMYIARRYQVAGPNEALIIAGARGSKVRQSTGELSVTDDQGIRVVVGAGAVILPIVNRAFKLSLQTYRSPIQLDDGVTAQGIRVRVNATAVFKIGRLPDQIRAAAERFIGQENQIEPTVQQVLVGSMRGIVGKLTIDDLVTNRDELVRQVVGEAKNELAPLGIELDVLNIQDITDEGFSGQESYILQLGLKNYQTARQEAQVAQARAEMEIIAARREQSLRAAEAKAVTDAAEQKAAQAGPLAQAEAAQEVTRRQTELAELAATRREKELLAATVKPAAADAAAVIERAQGDRAAKIAAAEAEGQRVRIEGVAAADAIAARGEAEAEVLALRAEAYQSFNAAAIVAAILERLPEVVRAAAEPMSNISTLTVLSTDGASEVVRTATNTVAQATEVLRGMTGIDLRETVNEAVSSAAVADKVGDLADRLKKRREERAARAAADAAAVASAAAMPLTGGGTTTPETAADQAGISGGGGAGALTPSPVGSDVGKGRGHGRGAGAPGSAQATAPSGASSPPTPAPATGSATPPDAMQPAPLVPPTGTPTPPLAGGGPNTGSGAAAQPVNLTALDAVLERAGMLDDVQRMARLAREVPGVGMLTGTSVDSVVRSGALPAVVVRAMDVLPPQARTELGRLRIEDFFRHYAG